MDAVRPICLFVTAAAAVGCSSFTKAQIGRNTTVENSFPNGLPNARSQAPVSESPPPITPVAANVPLKKNEAQVNVVATIGTDTVITDEEVWHMVRQKAEQYANLQGAARTAKEQEMFRNELRDLIKRELIIVDFMARVRKNKPQAVEEVKELAKKEADRNYRMLKTNFKLKSDDELKQVLAQLGVTEPALRRQYERNILVDLFVGPTIRDKIKSIGLAELREYYDRHPDEFRTTDRAKWLYVTVLTGRFKSADEAKQYADWLAGQARGGADFVGLVKQYGMGDGKLRDGEGLGEKRGEIQPKELEETVFSLKSAGQVSAPVPTPAGYHVVKVVERDVAGVKPFDEAVQQDCRNKLGAQIQKQEVERLTNDLWRKYVPQVIGVP
jgi:peptidyl-prolyl cis-trans isomerase SurA